MKSVFSLWKEKDKQARYTVVEGMNSTEQPEDRPHSGRVEHESGQPNIVLSSKANMDKKSLDLLFAVDQVIQARQYAEIENNELQDRLMHASGNVDRLTRDLKNMGRAVDEREKNILELEQKLVEKNMKMDQLTDDYRELQTTSANHIEELKNIIDLEQQKYGSLLQKHNEAQVDHRRKVNELEEQIGKLSHEFSHLKQKFETQRQEKAHLLGMINDFTSRMNSPSEGIKTRYDGGNEDR